ncbi:MAG: ECF transporter S component [Bacillota bacterium]
MRDQDLRKVVRLALVASVVLVATMYLKWPTATGYIHLGDGIIYGAALAFGPGFAAVSGGLGSAMADVLGSYVNWAPWTLVIKAVAGWMIGRIGHGQGQRRQLLAMIAGAAWTVAGYATATSIMFSPAAALGESLGNLAQVGSGIVIGTVLAPVLARMAVGNGR